MLGKSFWRYENGLLAMMFITFGIVFLDRLSILFLMPFIAPELGLNNLQIGILTSALALAWAVSGFVVGMMADRKGAHKIVMITMMVIFSLCSIGSGFAVGFLTLLLARALMGLSEGPILPIGQSLMVAASSEKRRGFNMGLLQTSGAGLIGAIIGPPLVVWLANAYGWREAFYIVGIPGLILAVVLAIFLRAPRNSGSSPDHAKDVAADRLSIWQILRQPNILSCILIASACTTWIFSIIVFMPVYLVQVKQYTTDEMGLLAMATGVGTVVWGFVIPAISDRFGRRPTLMVFLIIGLLTPLAILYMGHSVPALAAAIFVGYTLMGSAPVAMATIPAESLPKQYAATALGLTMGISEVVGGVIAPVVAGAAADAIDPGAPFWIATGAAVVAFLLSFTLKETAPIKVGLQSPQPKASHDRPYADSR